MKKIDYDLTTYIDEIKQEIFTDLNCVSIGKIEKYTKAEQTAEIQIQYKRKLDDGNIIEYPLLVDCPVFILQGGGAFLEFPITVGDYCLVLFNDRDIDDWWSAEIYKEPCSNRKHSLSDGFALVGINPKTNVLTLDGSKIRLVCGNKEFTIEDATFINLLQATESFIKGDTLCNALLTLCTTIATATSGTTSQNAAGIETVKSAFSTFNSQINNFKSTKIKGE